jgi:hypothetical protein
LAGSDLRTWCVEASRLPHHVRERVRE